MKKIITLNKALLKIKTSIEEAILESGTEGKNNLIRTQKPIKLLHEIVKSELIKNNINPQRIRPLSDNSAGELNLTGFFKKKNQDVCVIPENIEMKSEILDFEGILYGQEDNYGKNFTERTLTINVRSQLSSSAKNFDTLYERTFAEALNLHLRCPNMVLGEFYMIAVRELDSNYTNKNKIKYKDINESTKKHIEKYILSFNAINNRNKIDAEHYKYERVCLLIVDFSFKKPKVYSSTKDLIKDGLLDKKSKANMSSLNFETFISDILSIYQTRF